MTEAMTAPIRVTRLDPDTVADWLLIGPVRQDRAATLARLVAEFGTPANDGMVRLVARAGETVIGRLALRFDARGRLQLWPPVFREGLVDGRKNSIAKCLLLEALRLTHETEIRYCEARFITEAQDAAAWLEALVDCSFTFVAQAALLELPASVARPALDAHDIVPGSQWPESDLLALYLACQVGTADRADNDPLIDQRDDFTDYLDPSEPTADRSTWRVAMAGKMPVGLLIPQIDRVGGSGWVAYIGVIPPYRRQGIGSALLSSLIASSANSVKTLTVMIDMINHKSLKLHRAGGFIDTGRRFVTFRQCTQI